jgi:hypothetical protein
VSYLRDAPEEAKDDMRGHTATWPTILMESNKDPL